MAGTVCKGVSEGDCELQLTGVLTGFCLVGSRELSALLPHVCYEPIWKRPATFQHGCFIMQMRHLYPEAPPTQDSFCALTQSTHSVTVSVRSNLFHICNLFNNKPRVELKTFLVIRTA